MVQEVARPKRSPMTSLLLQPLGPFILAIAAGLAAGVVATMAASLVMFTTIVLVTALVVAILDLVANLRAPWRGTQPAGDGAVPLVNVVWELATANVAVIAVVGAASAGVMLVISGLR
jgi:hypothetical protein